MNLLYTLIGLVILVFSAILHEIAHGFVADKLGDPTARLYGRLTLDPRKHIDPIMSVLVPLILILSGSPVVFGAAKPVPVDPFNLREGRKDIALVALAGPLTNLVIAIIIGFLLKMFAMYDPHVPFEFLRILFMIITYNLALAIFNLLPIPPLDGSKLVALLLPEREANQYLAIGRFGTIIIFLLLLYPVGGFSLSSIIGNLLSLALQFLGLQNLSF